MGKGGNAFHRFLDESYFAFWFRQWAAFFLVVGAILIIAGIVVFSVYPSSQESSFAQKQLVTSASDPNYAAWISQSELVSYTFLSINSNNLTCQPVGPFVYSVQATKTQVTFGTDGTATYQQSRAKTFVSDPNQSKNPLLSITGLNPSYINLVKNKSSEVNLFLAYYSSSTIVSDLQTFYTTTVPQLLAARAIGQNFQTTYSTSQKQKIFPSIFGTSLTKSINNYPIRYLFGKATVTDCPYYSGSGICRGVYSSLFEGFKNCTNLVANPTNFASELVGGFTNAIAGNCKNFLVSHGLTPSLWVGQANNALDVMNELANITKLGTFYDSTSPTTKGMCATRSGSGTPFSAWINNNQINDICDRLLQSFFNDSIPINTSQDQLGKRRFCVGPLGGSFDLALTLDSTVPSQVTLPDLALRSQTTYDETKCTSYISALGDVTGFVAPLYATNAAPAGYSSFSAAELTALRTYITGFEVSFQRWFTSLWLTTTDIGCTPSTCFLVPFTTGGGNSTLFGTSNFDALVNLIFPKTSQQAALAISFSDPKPLPQTSMFTPISDATGILSLALGLNNQSYIAAFGSTFNQAQYNELKKYANGAITAWYSTVSSGPDPANVGYLQFAQAKLACLANNPGRCSVAREFFGINKAYDAELGLASYVTTAQPTYYKSFDNTDNSVRDSPASLMPSLFNVLKTTLPATLAAGTSTNSKYFYFLLSTFIRDASSTSGPLPSRINADWLNGATDPAVTQYGPGLSATFAYDPDTPSHLVQINTGLEKAYTFQQINGATKVSAYPTPETVTGLYNPDGFPPGKISSGGSARVFDLALQRSFNYAFDTTTADLYGITTTSGTVPASEWGVNAAYGITTANVQPSLFSPYVTVSPCGVTLSSSSTCNFPVEDAATLEATFAPTQKIVADLKTGLVVKYQTCVVFSVTSGPNAFPITAPAFTDANVGSTFPSLQKKTSRTISSDTAAAYVGQFTGVKNTSLAVLLALVIVGGLFVIVGVTLLVFWFLRRARKQNVQSAMDLVQDPFAEKKSNVGNLKY